jgi:hypothetical protein
MGGMMVLLLQEGCGLMVLMMQQSGASVGT